MPTCSPATERLGEACLAAFVVPRERTDEHHPAPAETLFSGRQPGLHRTADLRCRPSHDVVEDDRHPVDDRQARKRVLQLVPKLDPLQHSVGSHRVAIVAPVHLDGFDVELVVMDTRPIDDPVDDAAPQPGRERRGISKLIPATPGAHDRLLRTILGLVWVPDEPRRQPHQSRQLTDQRVGELITGGTVIDRGFDQVNLLYRCRRSLPISGWLALC